jgi:DNA-binding transcriptional regulator LsrR (DeoR family)
MTLPWHLEARRMKREGWKQMAIAAQFNVSQTTVSRIILDRPYRAVGARHDEAIRHAWSRGMDTFDIAHMLNLSEAQIYNRLAKVRG